MLRPKKKISKKELKEDALISTYVKATSWYEENKKGVSIGLTVLAVIVVAAVVFINNRKANNTKATTDLAKVYQLYDNGQFQAAIDGIPEKNITGLKSIVDNYGSTSSGNLARFYLANAYFQLRQYDQALNEFKDFSPNDPLLEVSRLSGIASCYEAQGKHLDAGEQFEKASVRNSKDVSAAENLNNAARNYALGGQKEKALELYRRLKKSYPATTFGREADRFIARLSV
jgi:tetratricopeptide (TPR) repeat protein